MPIHKRLKQLVGRKDNIKVTFSSDPAHKDAKHALHAKVLVHENQSPPMRFIYQEKRPYKRMVCPWAAMFHPCGSSQGSLQWRILINGLMNMRTFYGTSMILLLLILLQLTACSQMTIQVSIATPQVSPPPASSMAQAVFQALNHDRSAARLPALHWNSALVQSAHKHNQTMMTADQLAHQLPGEAALGTRESQEGIQWTWAAENIGVTTDESVNGALGLHRAMMAERPPDDGHRQNILTTIGTSIGIDIVVDAQHNKLWLTEDFAKV